MSETKETVVLGPNFNAYTEVGPEGFCLQKNKVAFQTSRFTPQTSKAVIDNMHAMEAIANDPNDPRIEWDKPFWLPCVLSKPRDGGAASGKIGGIVNLGADGKLVVVEHASPEAEEDDDSVV